MRSSSGHTRALPDSNAESIVTFWDVQVVNSRLGFIVFPAETKLCPKCIGTNAWFLANNMTGETSGFSGTNDNHRLLPLQVRKTSDASLPSLSSTNGKMFDLVMRAKRYVTLGMPASGAGSPEAWRMLLIFAVKNEPTCLSTVALSSEASPARTQQHFCCHPRGASRQNSEGWSILTPTRKLRPSGVSGWCLTGLGAVPR